MLSVFQFADFVIYNLEYKNAKIEDETKDDNHIEFAYNLVSGDDDTYILSLLTRIKNVQSDHVLNITLETRGTFVFDSDNELHAEEKENMIKTNGSAIMFPYIRTLISNLTSADTHEETIVLPTINFSQVISDIDKKNQKDI